MNGISGPLRSEKGRNKLAHPRRAPPSARFFLPKPGSNPSEPVSHAFRRASAKVCLKPPVSTGFWAKLEPALPVEFPKNGVSGPGIHRSSSSIRGLHLRLIWQGILESVAPGQHPPCDVLPLLSKLQNAASAAGSHISFPRCRESAALRPIGAAKWGDLEKHAKNVS